MDWCIFQDIDANNQCMFLQLKQMKKLHLTQTYSTQCVVHMKVFNSPLNKEG